MQSRSFPPVASEGARVLVLGSLPGPRSLELQQYYAKPANAFWPIMGELFGAAPERRYDERLRILQENHVALWDVCRSAVRVGALDASIQRDSIIPNEFGRWLASYPTIRWIAFNGQTAGKLYRKLVLPELPESVRDIAQIVLPSTSPAYAAMRFEQKLERWQP